MNLPPPRQRRVRFADEQPPRQPNRPPAPPPGPAPAPRGKQCRNPRGAPHQRQHPNRSSRVSPIEFGRLASSSIIVAETGTKTHQRRFKRTFGLKPRQVSVLWRNLARNGLLDHLNGSRNLKPIHLLWTLMFLKGYEITESHCTRVGVSEKTFRKWVWIYIESIRGLVGGAVS